MDLLKVCHMLDMLDILELECISFLVYILFSFSCVYILACNSEVELVHRNYIDRHCQADSLLHDIKHIFHLRQIFLCLELFRKCLGFAKLDKVKALS